MGLVTVRMDEELMQKLDDLARLRGISRSALIKEILSQAVDRRSANPVREAALALRQGKKPTQEIDWSRIEQELQKTKPHFATVEEAIAHSRKRP